MKRLSVKQLEINEYVINKISLHSKNVFTTDDLVNLGIFSSNGWASLRRKNKILPKYVQHAPRIVTYKKEDVLDWINFEIAKDKSFIINAWNKRFRKFDDKKFQRPFDVESESKNQWIRDRMIETLVTNRSPELDKVLNKAFLILKEGSDGQKRKANQNTCHA